MRVFIFGLILFSTVSAASMTGKSARGKNAQLAPAQGIGTPGILIPFPSLKAEAELAAPGKPAWIFFSGSVFAPEKDRLDKIDPKTNKAGDAIAGLSRPCGGMVSAFGALWVPTCGDHSLVRLDPKTFKVKATIPAGAADTEGTLAATADSVWMLTDDKTTLSRIDPDQNAVVGELRVPAGCRGLTFGETALWLACPSENKVLRINPETNVVDKSIEVATRPEAIAVGEKSVWVYCAKEGKVDRIDPKTNKVSKTIDLNVPNADGALAVGEGFVWVTSTGFPLTRIDPQSETVAQQFYGEGGGAIQTSPGAIWLSNLNNGTLWRIDPKRVLATLAE